MLPVDRFLLWSQTCRMLAGGLNRGESNRWMLMLYKTTGSRLLQCDLLAAPAGDRFKTLTAPRVLRHDRRVITQSDVMHVFLALVWLSMELILMLWINIYLSAQSKQKDASYHCRTFVLFGILVFLNVFQHQSNPVLRVCTSTKHCKQELLITNLAYI